MTLTYRANRSGTLHAAYSGQCRVGYIERRQITSRWLWQLSLIRPEGGAFFGIEEDEESARAELEKNFVYWLAVAGLQLKEINRADQSGDRGPRPGAEELRSSRTCGREWRTCQTSSPSPCCCLIFCRTSAPSRRPRGSEKCPRK